MARKRFTAGFKAKVGLEALQNNTTIAELSTKYGVHPTQIQTWKALIQKQAENLFLKENKAGDDTSEKHTAELERKVGQLTIENDFLKKNYVAYQKKSGSQC